MSDDYINYSKLIKHMPDAFAYHQVIYDCQGNPTDYLFLEINSAFEKLTGLKRDEVIGRRVTEVHPDIGESSFDWIAAYGQVSKLGESIRFEQYFEPAGRWYDVSAFSDTPGYFAVSFREVTAQKNENLALNKLVKLAHDILQSPGVEPDYQMICQGLLELSDAKFAAINIYDLDKNKSVTKAIAGLSSTVRMACKILGYELIGKEWEIIPDRVNAIKEGRMLQFKNLYDAASGAISKSNAASLKRLSRTGNVYVIEVEHDGNILGDMIMFMPRYKQLSNSKIIELYATQIGFALMRRKALDELRESHEQYQSLVDNIPGTSYRCLYDEHWTMIYMSSDVDNITGYPSSDFINNKVRSYASVICADDNNNDDIIKAAIDSGEIWNIEYRVIHSNGGVRWVHERGRGITDEKGNVLYIDGLILDITERKKAEQALKESELKNRALIGAIPDLLFRYSSEGFYLDAVIKDDELLFEKGQKLYRNQELIGKNLNDSLPEEVATVIMKAIKKAVSSGEVQVLEYSFPVRNRNCYFEARLAPINTKEVVSIVRDITERKTYMAELEFLSLHDQLTGLYNRHYFQNELERLGKARNYPIAIISADLDGLKLINDTLGHIEGDHYLQNGADLLKRSVRSYDILARVGGDEFAIILPETDKAEAEDLVRRLQKQIELFNANNERVPLSISIGLSVNTDRNRSLEDVFKEADNAMYKDKMKRGQAARAAIIESMANIITENGELAGGNHDQVKDLSERFGRSLDINDRK